jgi:glycosyltransferase involved in cell wall biosynthesis
VRIGAILPHLLVFGGVRRYIELGNAFAGRGHEFSIYTPDGVPPAWLPFRGSVRSFAELAGRGHDVLVCGSPEHAGLLASSAARLRVFYLQLEGVADEREIVRSGRFRIMAVSSGIARRVRRRYGVEPLDGIGGVNPDLFHPVGRPPGAPFRVICYGRLSKPRKGARFVIDAVRSLRRRGLDIELDLFDAPNPGDPDPRIGFDPGMPYRFYVDPPQERMAAMYSASDAFASAERRAGWSNTAAEAAACGLPLVCTASGTEDFARDGESALVVRARFAPLVARSIARLYREPELRRRLGNAARERVMEFTWDRLCDRMERQFTELLPRS